MRCGCTGRAEGTPHRHYTRRAGYTLHHHRQVTSPVLYNDCVSPYILLHGIHVLRTQYHEGAVRRTFMCCPCCGRHAKHFLYIIYFPNLYCVSKKFMSNEYNILVCLDGHFCGRHAKKRLANLYMSVFTAQYRGAYDGAAGQKAPGV